MKVGEQLREIWRQATRNGRDAEKNANGLEAGAERKTLAMPAILSPVQFPGQHLPKPTPVSLRRFAETPVVRRAINVIKDRVAAMDWQVRVRRGVRSGDVAFTERKLRALRRMLEEPNAVDSFRTLMEQVIEDVLVGGFGAAEIDATGDASLPVRLYPVDGASVQVNAQWKGDPNEPRYAQVTGKLGSAGVTPLRDDELMYVRLNPRSHTVFGLGKVEVAFEAISNFLQAHRYAGRLASNSVVQYALWLNERTPEQHERLIRWWQDEVEGTGRVPVLSSEQKPEVLRFAGGTDADLRLEWQQFLLTMIANAFDLPAMLLGVTQDVNRSTAQEFANEAFQSAVVPLAKLLAEHLTRDVIVKRLGWTDLRFVWSELESRDESVELNMQLQMLAAGVLSVDEVRAIRGLPASAK